MLVKQHIKKDMYLEEVQTYHMVLKQEIFYYNGIKMEKQNPFLHNFLFQVVNFLLKYLLRLVIIMSGYMENEVILLLHVVMGQYQGMQNTKINMVIQLQVVITLIILGN